jgi:membrane associated rhomboid family serine protease
MFRLTPVTQNIIIINVFVFIAQWIVKPLTLYLGLFNIKTDYFQPYQLFTYMFAHADFSHIFWNMLMFAFAAPIMEDYWGQKRFLLFYIIAGLGAGAFYVIVNLLLGNASISPMIGASGAVYGVVTAFGIVFPNYEMRLLFLPISFKAKHLVYIFGTLTIWSVFRSSQGDVVAHLAHLGGIVVAMVVIQIWRSTGKG